MVKDKANFDNRSTTMPKSSNQKLKLIYLAKLMQEKTDDEHGLTMPEIIHELYLCGIKAERKSIYDDFEALSTVGMDIEKETYGGRTYYYRYSKLSCG